MFGDLGNKFLKMTFLVDYWLTSLEKTIHKVCVFFSHLNQLLI